MTVVVTGAGSGVGRALAAGFCEEGADVVGLGRTEESLAETARLHGRGRMRLVVGDVSNEADAERLLAEASGIRGKVDVLINNAAVYPRQGLLESSIREWREAIEINVVGVMMTCKLALPGMLERGHGRIINVGSYAWKRPIPGSSAYSVSKGALHVLTKAIAAEIDRTRYPDVLVNELIPGVIRSGMSESGEDPATVYPHARFLTQLPPGGPSGQLFVRSRMVVEDPGIRARLRGVLSRLSGGLIPG